MKHLNDTELVDLLDGRLPPIRAEHAARCPECRAQEASLRAAMALVERNDVPDPSPLFWDHLSARIAGAVDASPPPQSALALFLRTAAFRWAAAAIVLTLATVAAWYVSAPEGGTATSRLAATAIESGATPPAAADAAAYDAWEAIAIAVDGFELDETEALGIRVRPGSADRVVLEMSAEERSELIRLIEDEIKRNGA